MQSFRDLTYFVICAFCFSSSIFIVTPKFNKCSRSISVLNVTWSQFVSFEYIVITSMNDILSHLKLMMHVCLSMNRQ